MIELELQDETAAVTAPNVTVLVPWFIPKLLPDIMTDVPVLPELTESEEILGIGRILGVNVSFATYASEPPLSEV
jgi:hypothetical protein